MTARNDADFRSARPVYGLARRHVQPACCRRHCLPWSGRYYRCSRDRNRSLPARPAWAKNA